MLRRVWLGGFGLLLSACPAPSGPNSPPAVMQPADWQKIDVEQKFSLSLPPDFASQPVQGTDSLVRSFKSATATLNADYGGYSDPLIEYASKAGYREQSLTIDGRTARMISFKDQGMASAGVYFAEVGPPGVKLTLFIQGSDAQLLQTAERIFRSVDFP